MVIGEIMNIIIAIVGIVICVILLLLLLFHDKLGLIKYKIKQYVDSCNESLCYQQNQVEIAKPKYNETIFRIDDSALEEKLKQFDAYEYEWIGPGWDYEWVSAWNWTDKTETVEQEKLD